MPDSVLRYQKYVLQEIGLFDMQGYSFCLITEKDLYGVNIFIVRFTDIVGRNRILSCIVREVSEAVEIVHVRYVHWCQKVSVCRDQSGMRSEFF